MITYATYGDYIRMKRINPDDAPSDSLEGITDYLQRGRQMIDSKCRRRFFPYFQVRHFKVPMRYQDLSNRVRVYDDLMLDADLMEMLYVLVDIGTTTDTLEDVGAGGITSYASSFSVADASALDGDGRARFLAGDLIRIDNEIMFVFHVDTVADEVQVLRGIRGTKAAAHTVDTSILRMDTTSFAPGIEVIPGDDNVEPYQSLALQDLNSWTGSAYISNLRHQTPMIYVIGFWGFHKYLSEAWSTTGDVVPVGGITAAGTSIAVPDADIQDYNNKSRFEIGQLLRIEDELLFVTAVDGTGNTITVTRGEHGTLAYAHDAGAPIQSYNVLADILEANVSIAKTIRDADKAVGGRQGVSEMSQGVAITLPEDAAETIRSHVRPFVA